ncbi:hypothetical protein ILUMI_20207 [Ignelater luminosus]|uniref:Uncharacterized protein n=1 Tax=Ignelater luminosus TaxID=2038154 RepID=A0A8K0CHV0_IGNLU|nr:hypothetical protein ILUMI_20207 [Ignelater luminosus]
MLTEGILGKDFEVKQAVKDADSTIINNALQLGQQCGTAEIIAREDVDLFILLIAAAPASPKIYLLKPGKSKQVNIFYSPLAAAPASSKIYLLKLGKTKQADIFYSPLGFKYSDRIKNNILILHAFSGCDSTPAMFRQEKLKFVKTVEKNIHLQKAVTIFSKPDATEDEVNKAGH